MPEPCHEEIRGLDVPVHEAVFVRFGERSARLAQEHDHALGRLRPEAVHDVLQIETLQQLHDVVEAAAVVDAEVVELHRMRRAQTGGDLRFALEAAHQLFARRAGRRFLSNQLHRRGTGQEPVLGQPDFAHAAGAQGRDQAVAADCERSSSNSSSISSTGALRDENRALEHARQLANVARPRIRFEPSHRLRGHAVHLFADLSRVFPHEVINESRNILAPVLERRHGDRAACCGTRAAHVGARVVDAITHVGHRPRRRRPLEDILERALKSRRQLVNRLEKQRAARGELELARQRKIGGSRRSSHAT